MMKNKKIIWLIFIIQAIPIPLSLITIIGSIISLANITILVEESILLALSATMAMLLAGTYTITYAISLKRTIDCKKIAFVSFLPLLHILLFAVFLKLWVVTEQIYM